MNLYKGLKAVCDEKAYDFTSDEVRSVHRDSELSYQYLFS